MKSKKLGLINVDGNYELVNTNLFPYDKDSDEECKENLISDDLLRDLKALEIIKDMFKDGNYLVRKVGDRYYIWDNILMATSCPLTKKQYDLLKEVGL